MTKSAEDNLDYESLARGALPLYGLTADSNVTLINYSENLTYRIDEPNGSRSVLRVHRLGYQTRESILSEIAWMTALRHEASILTPQAIVGINGDFLQTVSAPSLSERYCVRFEWIDGEVPRESDALDELLVPFEQLGEVNARLHQHARGWPRPSKFVRQSWDFDGTIGKQPIWGTFRACPTLTGDDIKLLNRTVDVLSRRLAAFGQSSERYGLIHADVRLANLMFHKGNIRVIDFDDCGFCWFAYDFAAAISFHELDPSIPLLQKSWVAGYRSVARFTEEDENEIPTFIILRRILLTAWLATHSETPTGQELGPTYTDGTVVLAQKYLAQYG